MSSFLGRMNQVVSIFFALGVFFSGVQALAQESSAYHFDEEPNISAPSLAPPAPAPVLDLAYIDQRAEKLMQEDQMIGFALAVVEKGEISFVKGYGKTYPGGPAVDKDTVFRWASLSKGMAGTLAGVLNKNGALDLKAPISDFHTSLRLPKNGLSTLKVEDILSHQLGIVPNAYDTRLEDGVDPKIIRKDLGKLTNICTPGECHSYQNVAFDTISEVMAEATGKDYKDLVTEYIFAPLNMRSASLTKDDLKRTGNWARPFGYSSGISMMRPVELNDNYYKVPAAGGMNSSIEDLAQYMRAQMGLVPEVLPEDVLQEIHTPRTPTWKERNRMRRKSSHVTHADYALGWRVYDYAGHKLIGHRGAVRGYRAMILFDPVLDTGIVAMWNSTSSKPVGLQFELMDMAYGFERTKWMQLTSDESEPIRHGGD